MNDNRMTERRIAIDAEFWEPAPTGWRAPSKQIHRQHTPRRRIDWSGVAQAAAMIAFWVIASTYDYWGK